jgi:hypothetical protein
MTTMTTDTTNALSIWTGDARQTLTTSNNIALAPEAPALGLQFLAYVDQASEWATVTLPAAVEALPAE